MLCFTLIAAGQFNLTYHYWRISTGVLMRLACTGKAWLAEGVHIVIPCVLSGRFVRRRSYHRPSSRHTYCG